MKTASAQPARHWLDAWHVDPSTNRNYDFIDGLRGIAILMVLVSHAVYSDKQTSFLGQYFMGFAHTFGEGVALFFTLSGFLIALPFWKRKVKGTQPLLPPGYGWRRFWKIYPPLALSVLFFGVYYLIWGGDAPLFLRAMLQWLTGAAFLMPVSGRFNPVMWSLVVEIHFYLALPLLFLATRRFSARACLAIITLCLFAIPLSLQMLTGREPSILPSIVDPYGTGLSQFCFGVGLAGVDVMQLWNPRWSRLADVGWLAILLALLGEGWLNVNPDAHPLILLYLFRWLFLAGAGCLLCYATAPESPRARWLCAPWLRWFGIISYELYLFHQPMLGWARGGFGPAHGNLLKYAVILAVPLLLSITVSATIYRWFSLPILRRGRARKSAAKG